MRRATLAVVAAAAAFVPALAAAQPASAAGLAPAASDGSGLLLSSDGVHWSSSLPDGVFDTSKALVPGDALAGRFYVKNDRDTAEYLRVGLSALTVTDWDLAQSVNLTMIGTTPSDASGSAASFAGAGIVCTDLLQRTAPVPAGGIVLITADLRFRSSTDGTDAQGSLARIDFIAQLSDIDLNATDTPLCDGSVQIGPVDPQQGGGTGGGTGTGSGGSGTDGDGGTGNNTGAGDGSGTGDGSGNGSGSGATEASPGIGTATGTISFGPGADGQLVEPANTMRLYEEYAVLVLLGAVLAGMLLRLAAQRRWERMLARIREGIIEE